MITTDDLKEIARSLEAKCEGRAALVIVKGGKPFRLDAQEISGLLLEITQRLNSLIELDRLQLELADPYVNSVSSNLVDLSNVQS